MKLARVEIERRRDRVQRILAARPAVHVEVTYAPRHDAREALIVLLLELLDGRVRSGGV